MEILCQNTKPKVAFSLQELANAAAAGAVSGGVLGGAAVAVNSASPRSNAELEQAHLAELNRLEEEELFAELERDWYDD